MSKVHAGASPTVLDGVKAYSADFSAFVRASPQFKDYIVTFLHFVTKKAKKPLALIANTDAKQAAIAEEIDEECLAALPMQVCKNADEISNNLREAVDLTRGYSSPFMMMNTTTGNIVIDFYHKKIAKVTKKIPAGAQDAEAAFHAVVSVWLSLIGDPTDGSYLDDNEDHCGSRLLPGMLTSIYKYIRELLATFTDADLKIPALTRRALLLSTEKMKKQWHRSLMSNDAPWGRINWPVVNVTVPPMEHPPICIDGLFAKTKTDDNDDEDDENGTAAAQSVNKKPVQSAAKTKKLASKKAKAKRAKKAFTQKKKKGERME